MTIQNKTIWTLWLQGFENAPAPVKLCLESWQRRNAGWTVEPLDRRGLVERTDAGHIIDAGRDDISLEKVAAIGRLSLLARFGGVWADATVFCRQSLDEWLPAYTKDGFFAFRNPGRDRLMANWFIASNPDDVILANLRREFFSFWEQNYFSNQNSRFGRLTIRVLSKILRASPTRTVHWLSFVPRKILRVYPYSIFHYTFNMLALSNDDVRRQWTAARPLEATTALALLRLASQPDGAAVAIERIDEPSSPVYKLDWRLDTGSAYWRPVLDHLRSTLP